MTALVGAQGNRMCVFLHRRVDDFRHRTVMAEMNNFGTGCLQDSTHDINRRIVTIEQTRRGYETNLQRFARTRGDSDHFFLRGTHSGSLNGINMVALCGVLNYLTFTLTSTTEADK